MNSKSWINSKTAWYNVLSIVVAGASWGAGSLSAHPDLVCILVIVQALGNLILRKFTNTAIGKAPA